MDGFCIFIILSVVKIDAAKVRPGEGAGASLSFFDRFYGVFGGTRLITDAVL